MEKTVTSLRFDDAEIRVVAGADFQLRGHSSMEQTETGWKVISNGAVVEVTAADDEELVIRGQRLDLQIEATPAILEIEAEEGSVDWSAPSSGSKIFLRHGEVVLRSTTPIDLEVETWSGRVRVELPTPDSQSLELATSGRIWSDVSLRIERNERSEPSKRATHHVDAAPTLKVTSRRAEIEIVVPCPGSGR